jgi:inositol-hexakisphosphate 5-kinase
LIVYEGYDDVSIRPSDDLIDFGCADDSCLDPSLRPETDCHNTSYSYDADASNSSADFNVLSSHEDDDDSQLPRRRHSSQELEHETYMNLLEVSQESHHRGYGEAAARGAGESPTKTSNFIPISEDATFYPYYDTPDAADVIMTSSPIEGHEGENSDNNLVSAHSSPRSMDSWINYSSNSSDEYSCGIATGTTTATTTTAYLPHTTATATTTKSVNILLPSILNRLKSEANKMFADTTSGSDEFDDKVGKLKTSPPTTPVTSNTKRVRTKDQTSAGSGSVVPAARTKKKTIASIANILHVGGESSSSSSSPVVESETTHQLRRHSNAQQLQQQQSVKAYGPTNGLVDVRMIDFAHTTFAVKSVDGDEESGVAPQKKATTTPPTCGGTTKIHHGPDGGFIRGLDSLKRILTEILCEMH